MNTRKKILSLLLAAVMVLSLLPAAAFAAETPAEETPVGAAGQETPETPAEPEEPVKEEPVEENPVEEETPAAELSAAADGVAVQAANSTGTVYANTTVKISELTVGSIIKENVTLEDDTGASYVKINISDGTLKVNQDSSGTWTYVTFFKEKGVLEAFAGWGYSYDQLEVTENLYYVKQPPAVQYATGTLELNGFTIGKAKSDATITVTDGTGIASAEVIGFSSEGGSAYNYNKDDVFGSANYNVKVQVNLADGFEIEEADGKAVGITLEGAEQQSFSDGNCLIFKMNGKAASGESTFINFGEKVTEDEAQNYVKGKTTNTKGYTFAGWADEDGNVVDAAADATAGVTYTAKWTMNGKTVRTAELDLRTQTTDLANAEEGWSWDARSKTLTLSGATIDVNENSGYSGITLPAGAVISTKAGTVNAVTCIDSTASAASAITAINSLTIEGSGSLSVTGDSGIYAAAGIIAIKAPLTAKAVGSTGNDAAIWADGNGTITVDSSLTIQTPANGAVGKDANMAFVADENGKRAKEVEIVSNAPAAPVFADGFGKTDCAFTAYQKGDKNTKGYTFAGWFDDEGNELTDAAKAAAGVTYTAKWTMNGKTVRTTALDLTAVSANRSSTDEGWSWDAKSKTLTLSGATIDVNDAPASIALPDGATVATAKNTKNTVVNGLTGVDSGVGVLGMGKLTVNGDGQLSAAGVAAGLYAVEDLTINAPVTAKAAGADGKAVLSLEKVTLGKAVCVKTPDGGSVVNNESMGFVADKNGKAAKNVVIASADSKPPVAEKATFTDGLGNTIDNASGYVKNKTKNDKGYTFAGWVDEDGNVVDKAADAVSGKVYTARWQAGNGKLVRTEVLDLSSQTVDLKDIAEGWSWDAKSKTLTLNGVTIDVNKRSSEPEMEGEGAILLPDGAVIVTARGSKNVVINGSTIEGAFGTYGGAGIEGMGDLTIKGSGQLSVTGGNYGIAAMVGRLTINAPISVKTTGTRGNVYAVIAEKMTIGSSLRVKTPAGGKLASNEHGMFVADRSGNAAADVVISERGSSSSGGSGSGTATSAKTGDAGIALYAGMAIASLMGSGVVFSRKRRNF